MPLRNLAGEVVPAASLRHQWLLIVADGGSCVADCESHLYMQRQLREMLGRERERLDQVWLVTDDVPIQPALREALAAQPLDALLQGDVTWPTP